MNNAEWERIIADFKDSPERYRDLHKIYHSEQGWIYLTDHKGRRYKITKNDTYGAAVTLIDNVRDINLKRL